MPPFSLTNQNGEPISLDTFRGQSFVLTFVFTRCPVPNFCPRMSNNFEELFHHADPKIWTFATGDEKNIDSLLARFPFTGKPRAALSHMASPPP